MQSSGSLPTLPSAENLFGRLDYAGVELRNGQRAMVEHVAANPEQPVFNGVMPTGYGKSKTAECICDILKQQGRANRFLFVVPTDTQREQYASDIGRDVLAMGLDLRLMESHDDDGVIYCAPMIADHPARVLRAHRENRCEVFITTIQSIVSANKTTGWYAELMSTGRWMVFADEYQKLNMDETATWGKTLSALNYSVLLGLTATPIRSDRKDTVFADKTPDVEVTFKDAYEEKAIRRVVANIEHYFVDVIQEGEATPERVSTENIDDFDLSRDLRFTTKYYASLISSAHDCLASKNLDQPGQHQMLVFAMSVAHAKSVSDTVNALFGNEFSKWVGVGPHGRQQAENRSIIADYKANRFQCLVQVDMATEGFDNPRSSVLVFLTLMRKTTVKARQAAGRGVRRNYGIEMFKHDVCNMFVSPDTEMAELIAQLASQTIDNNEAGEDQGEGEPNPDAEPRIYDIPPFDSRVVDSEYDRSEVITKIPQKEVDDFREAVVKEVGQMSADTVTDERLVNILANQKIEDRKRELALIERPENQKDKVIRATSVLVGNVARVRYGASVPKTTIADIKTSINKRWVRLTRKKHNNMLEEDFREKYEWLQSINSEIKTGGGVPLWLQI